MVIHLVVVVIFQIVTTLHTLMGPKRIKATRFCYEKLSHNILLLYGTPDVSGGLNLTYGPVYHYH